MNIDVKMLKNICKWNLTIHKIIIHYHQIGFIPGSEGWLGICKWINERKDKSHKSTSLDAEKELDKIQHLLMIKTVTKVNVEGTYLYIIKTIYNKPTVNIILNSEKLKAFLLNSGTRQGCQLSLCMRAKSLQSCSTVCDPMDCSPPGSSVDEILLTRILKWVAVTSNQVIFLTCISCTGRQDF